MELAERTPEVLAQFSAGELAAFEHLFRLYQRQVYGWIVRIVRDPASAEDLTVETFWRIYRAHARFDPGRSFEAWARKIATNVALDYLKSARNRETELTESLLAERPLNSQNSAARDPALRREVRERTQVAFQQLPPKLRVVAALALIEEQPQSEIAETLSISVGAVKSRLFRAVRRLREKLGNLDTSEAG